MLTFEQKAGAWDGLKEAMMGMERSLDVSSECSRMAGEFLLIMRQVEEKAEADNKNLTTSSTCKR